MRFPYRRSCRVVAFQAAIQRFRTRQQGQGYRCKAPLGAPYAGTGLDYQRGAAVPCIRPVESNRYPISAARCGASRYSARCSINVSTADNALRPLEPVRVLGCPTSPSCGSETATSLGSATAIDAASVSFIVRATWASGALCNERSGPELALQGSLVQELGLALVGKMAQGLGPILKGSLALTLRFIPQSLRWSKFEFAFERIKGALKIGTNMVFWEVKRGLLSLTIWEGPIFIGCRRRLALTAGFVNLGVRLGQVRRRRWRRTWLHTWRRISKRHRRFPAELNRSASLIQEVREFWLRDGYQSILNNFVLRVAGADFMRPAERLVSEVQAVDVALILDAIDFGVH